MSPLEQFRAASRFLKRAAVVALAGAAGVGIALWPASQPDPATPAQQAAALAMIRCVPGADDCFALQRFASAPVCASIMGTNGGEPSDPGVCPGDGGFSAPPAAQRDRVFLDCAKRDGAIDTWHGFLSPSAPTTTCGVEIRMTRAQARAWINRLDAATSTSLVNVRKSQRPADLLRGGNVVSVWDGFDPADESGDAATTIDRTDPLDGGAP